MDSNKLSEELILNITSIYFLVFMIIGTWRLFSSSISAINFLAFRNYRFKRVESHQKNEAALKFVGDKNLDLLYADHLKEELFEKSVGFNFYNSEIRGLFLNVYPNLKKKFTLKEIYLLRNYFRLSDKKLATVSKTEHWISSTLIWLLIIPPTWMLYSIFSLYSEERYFSLSWLYIPVVITLGTLLIRLQKTQIVDRLRIFL